MGRKDSEKEKKSSKRRKRERSSSSSSSSSSSVSLSSIDEETKKKLMKKLKKLKKKEKRKKKEKKALKKFKKSKVKEETISPEKKVNVPSSSKVDVSEDLVEKSKSLAPMTKEEWEKQQNTLRRVYDEETGRMRLIKGTGEIVEECVSRERHLAINKQATKGDGEYFQKRLLQQMNKMEKSDVVEEFFGVYLLKCLNPKYKGRTYIGYTVDPNRRIKQHNKGKLYGGAWKTSQKGPWEMTLTVHGFPSEVAALRFEWAWQHPKRSRRLKSKVTNKKASESSFDFCLRVMFTMLTVPPWCRLPLTIRWLSPDVVVEPPPNLTPPVHMPIVYGPVKSQKLQSTKKKVKNGEDANEESEEVELRTCRLCKGILLKEETLICLNTNCDAQWHVLCLGRHFLENEFSHVATQSEKNGSKNILPVEGSCPECESVMLWGDIVRKKKGCYSQMTNAEENMIDSFC